jgi:hypothetical protein
MIELYRQYFLAIYINSFLKYVKCYPKIVDVKSFTGILYDSAYFRKLILTLLLGSSLCANAQPYCNQAQTTPGFPSNVTCQNAVCALDPFCCSTSWDGLCASTAATLTACAGCLSTNSGGGGGSNYNNPGGSISTCAGNFYDTGGSGGNYTNNQNIITTFCPATVGQCVTVNFSAFNLETSFDFLRVYDGPNTASPLIGNFTGLQLAGQTVSASSSNTSGCLTFWFTSDGSVISSGWAGAISCGPCPPPPSGPLQVSSNTFTPPQLITDVLLGSCVTASNITYGGALQAFGNFSNGDCIGIGEGILLTTGSASVAVGPNNQAGAGTNNLTGGSTLLNGLAGAATYDAAFITFNFVSTSSQVTFNYIFASEEYPEFVCSGFNDAFGFFVSGPGYAPNTNIAVVPGTTDPVTIDNVNNQTGCPPHYPAYYNNNAGGTCTQYDGYTTPLQAVINTVPCATYSITIAIADAGDGIYDSGVFLQAESFTAGVDIGLSAATSTFTQNAYEGCDDGYFMFVNNGPPFTVPTTVDFIISGNATMGVDYSNIPTSITFQPGQDTVYVTIQALLDMVTELPESVTITIPQNCTCDEPAEATLYIIDNLSLYGSISPAQQICAGQSVTLNASGAGSISTPFNFNWSNGQTGSSITVSPSATTTYSVEIDDGCAGQTTTLSVTVTVVDEFIVNISDTFCQGDTYILPNGSAVTSGGTYSSVLTSTAGCDSTVILNLTQLPIIVQIFEEVICQGESVTLPDGTSVSAAGSYDVTLASVVTGCDSTITTNVTVNPLLFSTVNEVICQGESVTLPDGTSVSAAGSYDVTLASVVTGCDSTITTNVTVNPLLFSTVNEVICQGESVTLPDGTSVSATGSYDVTLASVVTGCDSTITTNVTVNPLLFSTVNEVICQGESVTLPDGSTVSAAGSYDVVFGVTCDSTITTNVTVNPLLAP